jgi:hypothetical protein
MKQDAEASGSPTILGTSLPCGRRCTAPATGLFIAFRRCQSLALAIAALGPGRLLALWLQRCFALKAGWLMHWWSVAEAYPSHRLDGQPVTLQG